MKERARPFSATLTQDAIYRNHDNNSCVWRFKYSANIETLTGILNVYMPQYGYRFVNVGENYSLPATFVPEKFVFN